MALSPEDLIWVRNQIGDAIPPTDADLDTRYDVLADRAEVAREVLDRRLANLLATPATFAVSGEYSQSTESNIKTTEAKLAALGGSTGSAGVRIVTPEDSGR